MCAARRYMGSGSIDTSALEEDDYSGSRTGSIIPAGNKPLVNTELYVSPERRFICCLAYSFLVTTMTVDSYPGSQLR